MSNVLLFLPACIEPLPNVFGLTRVNHYDRLMDHVKAIKFWIKTKPDCKILMVDNSNFSKKKLMKLIPNFNFHIQYLAYDGRRDSLKKGTGRGEIEIFKYAYDNSEIFRNADLIIKCSARYSFTNVSKLIKLKDFDLVGNFKNHLSFMDSRVFAFKPSFFIEHFYPLKKEIDDSKGIYFEHVLAISAHSMLSNPKKKWTNIPFPLIVYGISGKGKNVKYNSCIYSLLTFINYYRLYKAY